jgi:Leucine-rich repeat (LRR) protein
MPLIHEFFIREKMKSSMSDYIINLFKDNPYEKYSKKESEEYKIFLKSIFSEERKEFTIDQINQFIELKSKLAQSKYLSKQEENFIDNKTIEYFNKPYSFFSIYKNCISKKLICDKKTHSLTTNEEMLVQNKMKSIQISNYINTTLKRSEQQSKKYKDFIEVVFSHEKNKKKYFNINEINDFIEITKKIAKTNYLLEPEASTLVDKIKTYLSINDSIDCIENASIWEKSLKCTSKSTNERLKNLEKTPKSTEALEIHGSLHEIHDSEKLIQFITQKFKNLKKLKIDEIPMSSRLISKIMEKLPKLKELRLIDCNIDSLDFKKNYKNLELLDLSKNKLKDGEVKKIQKLPNLTYLSLAETGIRDKEESLIMEREKFPFFKLQYLDLSGNQISDQLAKKIAATESITYLNLSSNRISDQGAIEIAKMPNLTNLDLSSNWISDQGAIEIAKMPNLTNLDLSSNRISDQGAIEIAKMPNLTNLNLFSNRIGYLGAASFANNKSIRRLNLNYNFITKDASRTFENNQRFPSLKSEVESLNIQKPVHF